MSHCLSVDSKQIESIQCSFTEVLSFRYLLYSKKFEVGVVNKLISNFTTMENNDFLSPSTMPDCTVLLDYLFMIAVR